MLRSIFLILMLALIACSNNNDQTEIGDDPKIEDLDIEIISQAILKKENLSLTSISKMDFESNFSNDEHFHDLEKLCLQSKGYQSETWEGFNACSWGVEKEKIMMNSERVSRSGNLLQLKTNEDSVVLTNPAEFVEDSTYFQFDWYFPKSNFYVVSKIQLGQCQRSILINGEDGTPYNLKGTIIPSEDQTHFILYSVNPAQKIACTNKVELYQLQPNEVIKRWHLPILKKKIKQLKFTQNENLFLSLWDGNSESALNYIKLQLPKSE